MNAFEQAELEKVQGLLCAGRTLEAKEVLDLLQAKISHTFRQRDFWRLDELYGACFHDLGDMEGVVQAYWQASSHDRFLRSQLEHFSSYLFALHYLPGLVDQELSSQHFAYNKFFAAVERFQHEKQPKEKLRIGYLSPDFRDHAVGRCLWPFFKAADRTRYEVYGYTMRQTEDETTQRMRKLADGWRCLAEIPFAQAARQIYDDQIDILVDLAGHSDGGRTLMIAAYKPAPVQLTGIGWFDTTGLSAIDYFLTDRFCAAGEQQGLFSEALLRLPHTHLCYTPVSTALLAGKRVGETGIRFGCLNNFAKITDEMLVLWRTILQAVPGAQLLLKDTMRLPERLQQMRKRVLAAGFSAGQVEICGASERYLSAYQRVDIALDTYPYPGGITSCDALYMGTPLVTLAGTRHSTRFGLSILQNLDLTSLIADNPETYKEIAVTLARNRTRLRELQGSLRQRMQESRLMNGVGYMRDVEKMYEKIWQIWLGS